MILAIDTSSQAASACLWDEQKGEVVLQERVLLQRGHDLVVLAMIERLVQGVGFSLIDRIAVAVGPGSFTGMRVGIAAAIGLGVAQHIPVVGVSSLAAFAAPLTQSTEQREIIACIDARHGRIFVEVFGSDGRSLKAPALRSAADVAQKMAGRDIVLVGSGAIILAEQIAQIGGGQRPVLGDLISPSIVAIAQIGYLSDPAISPPKPLYLKEADVTAPKVGAVAPVA